MTPNTGEREDDPWLVKCDPWFSQGDVFTQIPVWQAGMLSQQTIGRGPAMLVTRSCDLDKAKNNGLPMIEFMNFLPLQSFPALRDENPNKAAELKRRALEGLDTPYSVLYLGDVPQIGECYAPLTQPYSLPAELFRVSIQNFTEAETGDHDPEADHRRLMAGANDTRVGRLGDRLASLFHRKWIIHWTGMTPAPETEQMTPDA